MKNGLRFLVILLFGLLLFSTSSVDLDNINETVKKMPVLDSIPPKTYIKGKQLSLIENTKKRFPKIKGIPPEHEEAFLLAFHFYPELEQTEIVILQKKIGTTMQTQPKPGSVFRKAGKRTYKLFLNNNNNFEGVLFDDIPFNAQIGLVAHELAHIMDYENKNTFQLIGTGLRFLTKKGRAQYEKSVDLLTIHKGYGWQLYDWADYSFNNMKSDAEYIAFKKKNYLSPEEIEAHISNLKIYKER